MPVDRGLLDKAINIINNVGNYGPLDATIDSYKQAADYAEDARLYSEQAASGVDNLNTQITKVTELANKVDDLEKDVTKSFDAVTTLDVDAVNGSTVSAVYNKTDNTIHFIIPSGVDGKDGKDGINGTNGTNGKSAYQLAVDSGYTGTLQDFNDLNTKSLDKSKNLSDVSNGASARTNLSVYSKAETTSLLNAKAGSGANSDIKSLTGLTTALSISQGGTGAKTYIAAKANLGINLLDAKDYGAIGDGTTVDTTSVNSAVAVQNRGPVLLPNTGTPEATKYLVGNISNKFGVRFTGGGALVQTDPVGGIKQINFAQDTYYPHIGFEYLYAAYKKISGSQNGSATTLNVFVYGDSTVAGGNGEDPEYKVEQLLPLFFGKKGIPNVTVINRGVGGSAIPDLNAISDISATTKLFIIKYGINDGGNGRSDRLDYFATTLRSKLAAIRATANGNLSNLSIILVGPNSTNDSPNNRNAYWYEQLRGIYLQAARDYQCAYFDTYSIMPDSYGLAGTVLDAPPSLATGVGIHPMNLGQAWIWGKLVDTYFNDASLYRFKLNSFVSFGVVNGKPPSTTLPTNYQRGINWYRGQLTDGYPIDGIVETDVSADSAAIQRNYGFNATTVSKCLTRTFNVVGNTWNAWTGTPIALTGAGGWTAVRAEYRVSVDGFITISAYLTGGTTASGTTILTGLPADARPSAEKRFAQCNDDGTHTCVGVSNSGNIFLVGSSTNSAGIHVNLSYYI